MKNEEHPCPICRKTMFESWISFDICGFCGWEDDIPEEDEESPDSITGPNEYELLEYRQRYRDGWLPDCLVKDFVERDDNKQVFHPDIGILQYTYNLFSFPEDYFTSRTAEELHITAAQRQEIIQMQQDAQRYRDDPEYREIVDEMARKKAQELLKLFEEA
ncbi:CPCC family cysteine-rich protein [Bengtsoniella intestinalis]|uniref:CPCC family cysteine-rich protein n=1 Tax=Bengtsoniella intestinalis TaxID=3073143 RepID=UPI00391FBF11